MKNMTLSNVAKAVEGQLIIPEGMDALKDKEIQGAVTSEVTNVLNKLSLLDEDVKGIDVDKYM